MRRTGIDPGEVVLGGELDEFLGGLEFILVADC